MLIEIPIDVWDPARGGAEGYLRRLVRGLAARGHRCRILCLNSSAGTEGAAAGRGANEDPPAPLQPAASESAPGGPLPVATGHGGAARRRAGEGIEVERLRAPAWPRWRRELAFARAARARRRAGGADVTLAVRHVLEADVYQPHGGPFRVAVRRSLEGVEPAALRRVKLALRLVRPSARALLALDRAVLRSRGLTVVSLSRMVEDDFRSAYPEVRFRFERIYNGVDLDEFHDRDRPQAARALRERFGIALDRRVALFVGHKFGPKGLATAIRALERAGGFDLVVAGGGRPRPFVRLARALGIAPRVHFAGAVEDTRPLYAGADALVLPTHYDPCSLSALEALASGVPVVTTTRNGAGELIEPGREGFVVAPGDPVAVAVALERIRSGWDRFHAAALARARDLSFDRHLDAMEAVLERAQAERREREGRQGGSRTQAAAQ